MSLKTFLAAATFGIALAAAAHAQTTAAVAPMVIYDDGLQNNWQNWSWGSTVDMQVPAGGVKPMKVEGGAWSALDLHHDAVSTAGYTKLTFYVNGGVDGGQTLTVHVKIAGQAVASSFTIQPKVRSWDIVEVPLKDIGAENVMLEDVFLQGGADAFKPYYIDKIQLE